VGAALTTARIDIVGGETEFFDKIVGSIKAGKSVDRWVNNSQVLTDIKSTFFGGEGNGDFRTNLKQFTDHFGLGFEDVKDLSVAALIGKMLVDSNDDVITTGLKKLQGTITSMGLSDKKVAALGLATLAEDKS